MRDLGIGEELTEENHCSDTSGINHSITHEEAGILQSKPILESDVTGDA